MASRNAGVCSASQSFRQAPERPGANPMSRPGPVVSASTNVSHGSVASPPGVGQDPPHASCPGLVDPEHPHRFRWWQPPGRGRHQCPVRRRPRHPVSPRDLLHSAVARRDRLRQRDPQPAGQPRPGSDGLGLLRERPPATRRLPARQTTRAPPQLDPLTAGGQVLDPHQRPIPDPAGDHPAPRAGRLPGLVLDDDPQVLAAQPLDTGDDELVFQAEQH